MVIKGFIAHIVSAFNPKRAYSLTIVATFWALLPRFFNHLAEVNAAHIE